jgi:hypothetical protein
MQYKYQAVEAHRQTDLLILHPGAVSVSGGCSQERVSTTRSPLFRLASSLSLGPSLSGRSVPFAAIAKFWVRKPSYFCQVPSQVGSSHEVNRGLSWMPPRCRRFRVKLDTCVTSCHPSSNLGRNLFPRGVFLPHPIQQVEKHSVTVLPVIRVSDCTPRASGLRAVVRCSRAPRWASPSKCYYYYPLGSLTPCNHEDCIGATVMPEYGQSP